MVPVPTTNLAQPVDPNATGPLAEMIKKLAPALMQQGQQQDQLIDRLAAMGPPPQPMIPQAPVPGVGQVIGQMQGAMAPAQPRGPLPPHMMRGEMLTRPQVPGIGGAMMGAY